MISWDLALRSIQGDVPEITFKQGESLAKFTTVHIGGQAEYFLESTSAEVLKRIVNTSQEHNLPFTILGWGANTLIADRGLPGLVIRNRASAWREIDPHAHEAEPILNGARPPITATTRHQELDSESTFADLDYVESSQDDVYIEVESGIALAVLISQTLTSGFTGLQWFSRIPATLGGAIVNNVHGGTHFLSEFVCAVQVISSQGTTQWLSTLDCNFGYDFSRFHHSNEVILKAVLILKKGDVEKARSSVSKWARHKSHQPQRSLGCIFQNLTSTEQQRLQLPTPSVGYLIDKILKLAGFSIGGARISNAHAAFIENVADATATEYLAVIRHIVEKAQDELGVTLKPEIFFKGFLADELDFFKS